nr:hypothetical protein [Tanacetum cinerariifolium]
QISSRLDLTYAPSTITTQQPTEGKLDLLFEAMYDDYIGGQPLATPRTALAAQAPQDVDGLETQQHAQQQENQASLQPEIVSDNIPNAMFDDNTFNVKEALTDSAWIESMQEELLQFKRLDVWLLVPAPDNITPFTLKWLLKNKHDKENTVIRNKTCLVVRGYCQEEGLDFKESFALDSGFELTRFSDADYAGCKDTFKSTFGGAQFLGEKLLRTRALKKGKCSFMYIYPEQQEVQLYSIIEEEYNNMIPSTCALILPRLSHNRRDLPRNTRLDRVEVLEYQVKDQDPRSQACKRIFKRIPKNTRLQDSRRHKKDLQLIDHPLREDC